MMPALVEAVRSIKSAVELIKQYIFGGNMNYEEALDYIHNTLKFGIKLGLHNIEYLLDLMGNPHKKLKFVHVGGTNGKGSTVAFISSILIESGYKVGIYTSPYIERFTERIKINSEEISESDIAEITEFVKSKVDIMTGMGANHPTEFEIVTAIAFQYFYENNCDIVILEVGLGGRFDSTNIIEKPVAAVITTISFDHTDRLGNTLAEIAFEKAGIIKEQSEVIIYPQEEEAERVIINVCNQRRSNPHLVDFNSLGITEFNVEGQRFNFGNYNSLRISLLGEHQVKNAVIAIKTSEVIKEKGFIITENSIRLGLANAVWPGRLEVINKKPMFIIDGAHNAEGASVLAANLKLYFPEKRVIIIIGVLKDKDYKSMIEAVIPISYKVISITPESDRALPASDLAILIRPYCKNVSVSDTIEDAIRLSLETACENDIICAFGSLYYIGKVRRYFLK